MELDWGTVIIGFAALVICVLPFVFDYRSRSKKTKHLKLSLAKLAEQHNCEVNQYEYCSNFILGIDENRNSLFFFRQPKTEEGISQYINLEEIQKCEVVKKTKNVKTDTENLTIVERVEMSFIPSNTNKVEQKIELFDKEKNMQLNGELQFVDKWSKQINGHLKSKK
ncbi:hypothetical protein [Marivirga sp.]|uniref:hypothetical protein n=1 Tax=Marivirga sp. TaxID=2018662 RepID=UPI002D7E482C|nr:hypothetical protein [Marivirga sp.]HET8860796.1 hypothetical protein [Marivirga sp.]